MIGKLLTRLAAFSIQKTFLLGLLVGGIYYMMFYESGESIEAQIANVQTNIDTEEQKSKEADLALREVEQVRITVGALSEQFKTVSQALPTDIQMADIIRAVDKISRSSGVSIKSKEPRPVIDHDYYEEIPLRITMEGNYSEVTLFLYYLGSTERIMKVNNFIIAQPSTGERVAPGRLLFEGQVVSYRFVGNRNKNAATVSAGATNQ